MWFAGRSQIKAKLLPLLEFFTLNKDTVFN